MSAPLAGLAILVTRPAHQADTLCALIEAAGGRALRLPALDIGPPVDGAAADEVVRRLDEYDLAVFVSPNAVRGTLALLQRPLPRSLRVASVGPATARALIDAGADEVLCPDQEFDSEALLRLPALQSVAGWRVVILRGDGGRGLLGRVLRDRGAEVEYAEVYRRTAPTAPTREVADALRRRQVAAVTVTSAHALEQLVALCGDTRDGLMAAQLVVSSPRMIGVAESLGFRAPLIAAGPGDGALVDTLIAWAGERWKR